MPLLPAPRQIIQIALAPPAGAPTVIATIRRRPAPLIMRTAHPAPPAPPTARTLKPSMTARTDIAPAHTVIAATRAPRAPAIIRARQATIVP